MTKTNTKTKGAPPVARFKIGSVQAAIWDNRNDDGKSFPSVTFKRGYKKQDGSWGTAHDYNLQSLLAHRAIVDLAIAELLKLNSTIPQTDEQTDAGYIEDDIG